MCPLGYPGSGCTGNGCGSTATSGRARCTISFTIADGTHVIAMVPPNASAGRRSRVRHQITATTTTVIPIAGAGLITW